MVVDQQEQQPEIVCAEQGGQNEEQPSPEARQHAGAHTVFDENMGIAGASQEEEPCKFEDRNPLWDDELQDELWAAQLRGEEQSLFEQALQPIFNLCSPQPSSHDLVAASSQFTEAL
jgi:hypothetical protein